MKGYNGAQLRPSPNFWSGFDQRDFIVVHATASGNNASEYVPDFNASTGKSTHYAIAMDGTIVQYVDEDNSAWGNCCATGNSSFRQDYNWNKSTVSIENEKHSDDNSTPLTDAQYKSLLVLVRDIAKRWNIPLVHGAQGTRGVIFHHDIDPVNRARCPGTFPYDTFFQDLNAQPTTTGGTQLILNKDGCVIDVTKSFQLETEPLPNIPGSPQGQKESYDLCGPWSVTVMTFANQPNGGPLVDAEKIDRFTDDMVDQVFKGVTNHIAFPGVDPTDMIKLLNYARDNTGNIHYQVVPPTLASIRGAIAAGYGVIASCNEADVYAWFKEQNQWVKAYPWTLSAGHVFPVTGVEKGTGNLICPDQLNNSYQKYWPPIYDASRIANSLSWVCIVKQKFLKDIPGANILTWPSGFNAQNFATGGGGTTPPPPAATPDKHAAFVAEWTSIINVASDTGIAKAVEASYWTGEFHGPALSHEFKLTAKDGRVLTAQVVAMGIYLWDGSAHYYSYKN